MSDLDPKALSPRREIDMTYIIGNRENTQKNNIDK